MKLKLKRRDFEDYIWNCFLDFLNKEENHDRDRGGKQLKKGKEYYVSSTKNRNPRQVPKHLWVELLKRHLHNQNYN